MNYLKVSIMEWYQPLFIFSMILNFNFNPVTLSIYTVVNYEPKAFLMGLNSSYEHFRNNND